MSVPSIEKLTALHPWTVVGVRAGDLLDCIQSAADAAAAARTELSTARDILTDYRQFGTVAELRAEAERLKARQGRCRKCWASGRDRDPHECSATDGHLGLHRCGCGAVSA